MKRAGLVTILFFVFGLAFFSIFETEASESTRKKAVYFYSDGCEHCGKVEKYFLEKGVYEKYDIDKIEVASPYNALYLNRFFDAFGVPQEKRGFPVIFFEDRMILGDDPIIQNFIDEINKTNSEEYPVPEKVSEILRGGNEQEEASLKRSSLAIIAWAAMVDAINPCAFAVMVLLVATVMSAGGRRRGLHAGLLFSLAVYVVYFLIGIGVYQSFGFFRFSEYFSLAIGALAIFIGLANLKDFFWYGKIFFAEVPLSWRPKMQTLVRNVTGPKGAFVAGLLVSFFLLPCAGGPYVVVIGMLAKVGGWGKTLGILAIYNLIFILPMIIISLSMYYGVRARGLEEWRQKNARLLHLISGAIMLFIGLYLVYTRI